MTATENEQNKSVSFERMDGFDQRPSINDEGPTNRETGTSAFKS